MVDTIRIWVDDPVIIRYECPVLFSQPLRGYSTNDGNKIKSRFSCEDGEDVVFTRASYQDAFFRIDAHHQKMWIQFSLANFACPNRYSLEPYTKESAEQALSVVQNYLHCSLGIKANLESAFLSRIDLFRDIITDHAFTRYLPLLRSMRFLRQKRNAFDTTTGAGNEQRGTCIYDKTQQLRDKKTELDIPDNILRWEYRLKKGRSIRKAFDFNTVSELFLSWESLIHAYRAHIVEVFQSAFIPESSQHITQPEVLDELFSERGGRGVTEWVKLIGWVSLLETYESADELLSYLKSFDLSRQQLSSISAGSRGLLFNWR